MELPDKEQKLKNQLTETSSPETRKVENNFSPRRRKKGIFLLIIFSLIFGFIGGIIGIKYYSDIARLFPGIFPELNFSSTGQQTVIQGKVTTNEEKAVTSVVSQSINSVVSILSEGEVSIPGFPSLTQEVKGAGSGFIVSSDGMILTNKHVVQYTNLEYTVILQNSEKYKAQVLARDPIQDLAILKIKKTGLKPLTLGDSNNLQIGQTVIAIGNALGEFQNTVSVGVVSGLSRKITAGGGGTIETLEQVIQTDAAINEGNSGGPLLNLSGQVIGINTAMASGAENIGFAIPINIAKAAIDKFKEKGEITYPFLGVSYLPINEAVQEAYNLPVNYGALIAKSEEGPAVVPGSGADKAGIKENDIILEMDGRKITEQNTLSKMILNHKAGDKVKLKILRKGKTIEVIAELGERSE